MNDFDKFLQTYDGPTINKWSHYFDIYDCHFSRFRGKDIVVVEIGVWEGGSLLMWKDYFGENAKIYGIDWNPACAGKIVAPNIEILTGSQSDREFLNNLKLMLPKIDILIDDGGHYMDQQTITFEELFNHISDDGVYLCEDVHTSYWKDYNGGYKNPNSFIEYSKNWIDQINAYIGSIRNPALPITNFTQHVDSIHYYDSVVVVEKKVRKVPESLFFGHSHTEPYILR